MSLERVLDIVQEHLKLVKRPKATDKLNSLGADSLDLVELAPDIRKEFNIKFSDEEWGNITDIASIVALIKKKGG